MPIFYYIVHINQSTLGFILEQIIVCPSWNFWHETDHFIFPHQAPNVAYPVPAGIAYTGRYKRSAQFFLTPQTYVQQPAVLVPQPTFVVPKPTYDAQTQAYIEKTNAFIANANQGNPGEGVFYTIANICAFT